MNPLIRRIAIADAQAHHAREILGREWVITNGLGGYGSGTICGMVSRRYHGLLVAALPAPFGRMVMFNHLAEQLRMPDGRCVQIGGDEPREPEDGTPHVHCVREFRIENGLSHSTYEADGIVIEKVLLLIHGQNTVHVTYRLLSGHESVRLEVRPAVHFRPHEHDVGRTRPDRYTLRIHARHYEISAPELPHPLRLCMAEEGAHFIMKAAASANLPTSRNPSAATPRAACFGAPAVSPLTCARSAR